MTNGSLLLSPHTEQSAEIQFLKKEISFLLKLLKNAYSISVDIEKLKLLDSYWKGFEDNIKRLDGLLGKITEDKNLAETSFKENDVAAEQMALHKKERMAEFHMIHKAAILLKESFYEYMDGCCACSFKQNPGQIPRSHESSGVQYKKI
jgi:hypothetical protein